jgi:hypothetical protein
MTEHLSPEELSELCGSRGLFSQAKWLLKEGIMFRFNGRSIYVLRAVAKEVREPMEARLDLVR